MIFMCYKLRCSINIFNVNLYHKIMYDYTTQISEFIQEHFAPAENAYLANTRMTSEELLFFLFQTFPVGCISDYDLNEIMLKLQYKRETYSIAFEHPRTEKEIENNVPVSYSYQLATGWCMNSKALKEKLTN